MRFKNDIVSPRVRTVGIFYGEKSSHCFQGELPSEGFPEYCCCAELQVSSRLIFCATVRALTFTRLTQATTRSSTIQFLDGVPRKTTYGVRDNILLDTVASIFGSLQITKSGEESRMPIMSDCLNEHLCLSERTFNLDLRATERTVWEGGEN